MVVRVGYWLKMTEGFRQLSVIRICSVVGRTNSSSTVNLPVFIIINLKFSKRGRFIDYLFIERSVDDVEDIEESNNCANHRKIRWGKEETNSQAEPSERFQLIHIYNNESSLEK
ncbi:hypothetical protein CEXT_594841 [Caerostris extrusa]|uniref:Ycf15 n=1 Tax=Caerostris extrusa TaxID=172846 RepID=A0AAV4MLR5_CAEEX|nr:hypothetical protein CEXT_594841 [Caerostris extrusa]